MIFNLESGTFKHATSNSKYLGWPPYVCLTAHAVFVSLFGQVKVAKSAIKQALTWNEDDDIGVSKAAALRIVVLEGTYVHQF